MAFREIQMPDLGEGVTEGEIIKVHVKLGDNISLDDPLLEVMTDKASMEIPSLLDGIIKEVHIKEGDIVPVGKVLIAVQTEGKEPIKHSPELKKSEQDTVKKIEASEKKEFKPQASLTDSILVAPSTRKLAQELGVNLKEVSPSGAGGEILRNDLLRHIKKSPSPHSSSSPTGNLCTLNEGDRAEPIRGIKRIMSETMTLSKQTIPHFTIIEEACMDRLIELRSKLKPDLEKENIKLTYLPFIMKAVLSEIKASPIFNSQFDDMKKEIIYRQSCNLGFATDTEQGLLVPVIKDAQTKSILTLAKNLQELSLRARKGNLDRADLQGGTFTLTNLGGIGGLYGTPIIQPPQVAILGIYRFNKKLKKINESLEETIYSSFSLTCDHRVIDGAKATRFLTNLVLKIEEPERLLLE